MTDHQLSFDIDPQPSLFTAEQRDQLDRITDQATEADRTAAVALAAWARR